MLSGGFEPPTFAFGRRYSSSELRKLVVAPGLEPGTSSVSGLLSTN